MWRDLVLGAMDDWTSRELQVDTSFSRRRRRGRSSPTPIPPDHPAGGSEHYRTPGRSQRNADQFTLAPGEAWRPCLRRLRLRKRRPGGLPMIFGDQSAISFSVVSLS